MDVVLIGGMAKVWIGSWKGVGDINWEESDVLLA
jgi:hypothetical protein